MDGLHTQTRQIYASISDKLLIEKTDEKKLE